MPVKMFDSELKVMEILWNDGDLSAKQLAATLARQVGWSKTTTYTVIKKCIEKGAVRRTEPGFLCHALLTRREVQEFETTELINRMYDGAADRLVAALLGRKSLSSLDIEKLKQMLKGLE